ncbi:MAG TPA: response regulator [Armatimonadota bacterium]|nr:response regulator [Armatimonadota bacterium]
MKILLVEDERPIASVIRRGLEGARYSVDVAEDGESGLRMALERPYSLIILDVMLPGRDGWSICEALRARRNATPILMLTARDAVEDRIRGMELGADDYLAKPFNFGELIARVQSLLRRDQVHRARVIRIGDLEIDSVLGHASRGGRALELTAGESALLEALAANEGRVFLWEALRTRVAEAHDTPAHSVEADLISLRQKVDDGYSERLIHAVGGDSFTLRRQELAAAAR